MRERRRLIPILNAMLIVIILILALPIIFKICPFLEIGISVGTSMEPILKTGDMLFIRKGIEDLKIGDIISFGNNSERIVHRIVDIKKNSSSLMLKTRGDNNEGPDGWIRADQVKGKVIYVIFTRFLFSLSGLVTLILLSTVSMIIEKRRYSYKRINVIKKITSSDLTTVLLVIIFSYSLGILLGIHIFLR